MQAYLVTERAKYLAVAFRAILHPAGRCSAFRTQLSNMTGPHWFGLLLGRQRFEPPGQAGSTVAPLFVMRFICARS